MSRPSVTPSWCNAARCAGGELQHLVAADIFFVPLREVLKTAGLHLAVGAWGLGTVLDLPTGYTVVAPYALSGIVFGLARRSGKPALEQRGVAAAALLD